MLWDHTNDAHGVRVPAEMVAPHEDGHGRDAASLISDSFPLTGVMAVKIINEK